MDILLPQSFLLTLRTECCLPKKNAMQLYVSTQYFSYHVFFKDSFHMKYIAEFISISVFINALSSLKQYVIGDEMFLFDKWRSCQGLLVKHVFFRVLLRISSQTTKTYLAYAFYSYSIINKLYVIADN